MAFCYEVKVMPTVHIYEKVSDKVKEILQKLADGYQGKGLGREKLKGTKNTISVRYNDEIRLILIVKKDDLGHRHYHYIGQMDNHKHASNSLVQGRKDIEAMCARNGLSEDYQVLAKSTAYTFVPLTEEDAHLLPKTGDKREEAQWVRDYYLGQRLELTSEQEEPLRAAPGFGLTGAPGGGKTSVGTLYLIEKMAYQLLEAIKVGLLPEGSFLCYLTLSEALQQEMEEKLRTAPEFKEIGHLVFSMTYKKLTLRLHPELTALTAVEKDDCTRWYKNFMKSERHVLLANLSKRNEATKAKKKGEAIPPPAKEYPLISLEVFDELQQADVEKVYQEFRIISGYAQERDGKKNYLAYSSAEHHSHYSNSEQKRDFLFYVYCRYLQKLAEKRQFNLEFFRWTNKGEFCGGYLDEAQQVSLAMLENFIRASMCPREGKNEEPFFVVSIGTHQQGSYSPLSNADFVSSRFPMYTLTKTHRCPKKVIESANQVVSAKRIASPGASSETDISFIRPSREMENVLGEVKFFPQLMPDDWEKLRAHVSGNLHFAVLTWECYRKEAQEKLGTSLVFTFDEATGLEYDEVIIYLPLNNKNLIKVAPLFAQANATKDSEDKTKIPTNEYGSQKVNFAKPGQKNTEFDRIFDGIYIGKTRARKAVWVIQWITHFNKDLLNYLYSQCTFKHVDAVEATRVLCTNADWENELVRLYKLGQKEMSRNIFVRELKRKIEDFDAFLTEKGLRLPDAAPTPPLPSLPKAKSTPPTKKEKNKKTSLAKPSSLTSEDNAFFKDLNKGIDIIKKVFLNSSSFPEGLFDLDDSDDDCEEEGLPALPKETLKRIEFIEDEIPVTKDLQGLAQNLSQQFTLENLRQQYEKRIGSKEKFFALFFKTLLPLSQARQKNNCLLEEILQNAEKTSILWRFLEEKKELFDVLQSIFICREWLVSDWNRQRAQYYFPIEIFLRSAYGPRLLNNIINFFQKNTLKFELGMTARILLMPKNMQKQRWRELNPENEWFMYLLNSSIAGPLLSNLLANELKEAIFLIDKAGDNFLHYCVSRCNYALITQLDFRSGECHRLLDHKNNAQETPEQYAERLSLAAESQPAMRQAYKNLHVLLKNIREGVVHNKQPDVHLLKNFSVAYLKEMFIGNNDIETLSPEKLRDLAANFMQVFFKMKISPLEMPTAKGKKLSARLIYHVLQDDKKTQVLLEFLKANKLLFAHLDFEYLNKKSTPSNPVTQTYHWLERLFRPKNGLLLVDLFLSKEFGLREGLLKQIKGAEKKFYIRGLGKAWDHSEPTIDELLLKNLLQKENSPVKFRVLNELCSLEKEDPPFCSTQNSMFIEAIDENKDSILHHFIKTLCVEGVEEFCKIPCFSLLNLYLPNQRKVTPKMAVSILINLHLKYKEQGNNDAISKTEEKLEKLRKIRELLDSKEKELLSFSTDVRKVAEKEPEKEDKIKRNDPRFFTQQLAKEINADPRFQIESLPEGSADTLSKSG